MTANDFRRMALGMEGAIESSHMDHPDFRVEQSDLRDAPRTTIDSAWWRCTPDEQQDVHALASVGVLERESGAWGLQGATRVHLDVSRRGRASAKR